MFPTLACKLFGIENGGQIFTFIFFAVPIASLLGFVLVQNEFDEEVILRVAAVLTFVNIILLKFFKETPI